MDINKENRYRVEVTLPVWIYMEDEYMKVLDATTQETIVNKLADDLDCGAVSFMDIMGLRVVKDNPKITFDEDDYWVDTDPDIPINYWPTN